VVNRIEHIETKKPDDPTTNRFEI
ncbi:unnamed protein product, partial [Rotaria magnacalcarata]